MPLLFQSFHSYSELFRVCKDQIHNRFREPISPDYLFAICHHPNCQFIWKLEANSWKHFENSVKIPAVTAVDYCTNRITPDTLITHTQKKYIASSNNIILGDVLLLEGTTSTKATPYTGWNNKSITRPKIKKVVFLLFCANNDFCSFLL